MAAHRQPIWEPLHSWVQTYTQPSGKREQSRSSPVEVHKANKLQESSGLLNDSADKFLTLNGSSAPDGSVKLNIYVPGHALHEKGSQRQKSVVPLVGSQEQRAPLVPVINR